jgi:hypothetical protein
VGWVKDNLGAVVTSVVAVSTAAIISYTGLSIAQNDIEHIQEDEILHAAILAEIPSMADDIEDMEGSLRTITAALIEINKTLKIDAVEDARYHHTHRND